MKKIFLDTETVGFHGPIVLIQYAIEDGEVILYPVWQRPVQETIDLIDMFAANCVIGFNLAFDWFHFCQMYTTLKVYQRLYPTACFMPDPELYAECEPLGRDEGCLKPASAFDVMLHARSTEYQSFMDRNKMVVRKVPNMLAEDVARELNRRLPFKPVYFDRRKRKDRPVWEITDNKFDPEFSDIYVDFQPSSRLKALAKDALGLEDDPLTLAQLEFKKWELPLELGYAPFALAVKNLEEWPSQDEKRFFGEWKGSWPAVIEYHIVKWGYNELARTYAKNDVVYTRALYYFFKSPPVGDNDSILACMVGAVRWRGHAVDLDMIRTLRQQAIDLRGEIPRARAAVKSWINTEAMEWIKSACNSIEKLGVPEDTDKEALNELISWDEECAKLILEIDKQKLGPVERNAAIMALPWTCEASRRAFMVLEARHAQKEIETYDKILIAGRFHVSLKVTGTLSGRMAGGDDLNAQGIKKAKYVRKAFTLAFPGWQLCGGDFSGFEVTIAAALYDDEKLNAELVQVVDCVYCHGAEGGCKKCEGTGKEGKKIHATFGTFVYPGETYESIRLTDGQTPDLYTLSKSGLFTWLFAGTYWSLLKRLGIPEKQGKAGLAAFERFFPKVGQKRSQTMEDYALLSQPDGIGTKIVKKAHKYSVETMQGFSRRFDLEYEAIEGLSTLAEDPPESWKRFPIKVIRNKSRRDGEAARPQLAAAACQSAIVQAAFELQGNIQRAAINHPIQGTGALITKQVQCDIWTVQEPGYNPWRVIPINIHDEINAPVAPEYVDRVEAVVKESVKKQQKLVPLLKMDWKTGMKNWAEK